MGKKKEKTFNEPESTVDLKSIIHENALFFDKLVELIPARFYLPDEKDKPWFQGLSKAEKASAKKQSRENIKKARRDRLDPEKSSKTTLDLLKENLEKEKFNQEKKDVEEAAKELTFSHVKLGDEEKHGKKKRKLSKFKELENAMKLEEAKKDPEKGEVIAKKHSWKAAMDRAAGVKVHDDPKLLKHSIWKEKKRHQKNVEKWNERVETTEKLKAGKQQKRSENIADKIHQKKMRRIAKREKKLLRPGFEGRKEGFINEGST
ncbi:hypothetical protein CRYUN_Cryun10bG0025400 [Craigia yunnanensis]